MNKNDDIKEDFCGVCAAVPLAMAGMASTATSSSLDQENYNTTKKLMLWGGMGLTLISIIIFVIWIILKCKK